jgi:hypothetical protein
MSASSASVDHYLTRCELAAFLTERGFPISKSTLDKLAMPSRGEGPPMSGAWGGRGFYDPAQALAWAQGRFRSNELRRSRRRGRLMTVQKGSYRP